ncbi:putative RNA helicase [Helianthus annuus]|uniref:Putative helicase, P-loop containing nucleoside triphosphate hydrolase n=2 Tax=Helianthus annuus TaxID=4232 RepID=A0A251TMT4_HELAN|nr:putative RNA helicase [Helianthus annuus]
MVALGSKYFKELWLFMSYFGLNSNKTQLWSMCSSSICHHDRCFHLCILTQMDGFDQTVNVKVITATNRADTLDLIDSVKQYKVNLPDELSKIIKDKIMKLGGQTVIFGGTRKSAQTLHEALVKHGYAVTTIEGALTQDDKDKIIEEFKDGLTQVLISTHFLAQGFDQCQVNLVVNYDLPAIFDDPTELDNEAYLHRVGRAGRFGRKGVAFNLLCGDDDNILMEKIERHFHGVTEVPSDGDFKDALKKAGLM